MIGDFFFSIAYWFVGGIIGWFPQSTGFPPEAISSAQTIGGYFGMFSPLISISTLLTCLTLVFGVEIAIFGFRSLKWVISHIPLIGGKG